MDKEQLRKIIDSPDQYGDTREDSLSRWFADGWKRSPTWVMAGVWTQYITLVIPAVITAIMFFRADNIRSQLMHASIFLFCNMWIGFITVFGWIMIQRPNLRREIRRLELRIVELNETIAGKQ